MKNDNNTSRFTDFVTLVKRARVFATEAHKGIYRNCGELEYITHPIAVGKILHKYKKSSQIAVLVAACMLHDTVEDCDWVTIDIIREEFGDLVASLVDELTSDPKGIEKYGKEKYLMNKMTFMSNWGLAIKLADRLHNTSDIISKFNSSKKSDIRWSIKYANQTKNILDTLESSRTLTGTHKSLISEIRESINILIV